MISNRSNNTRGVIDFSEDSFRLGPMLEWFVSQREQIRQSTASLDEALIYRSRNTGQNLNVKTVESKEFPNLMNSHVFTTSLRLIR